MLALSAACVLAVVAVIALRAMTATAAPFSHSCLVGTWRNGARYSSVTANGHLISLYGGAGNVDHIFATGKDDESWAQSQPLYGKYQGHTLKEIIRGQNTLTIRRLGTPGKVSITEDGWSSGSSNTFSYQGGTYPGSMNNGGASKVSYHCTAHTLVWRHENGASIKRPASAERLESKSPSAPRSPGSAVADPFAGSLYPRPAMAGGVHGG